MTLQSFIETYGYAAVFAGALLEGETVLILAGFAAHSGYVSLPGVMAAAFVGGCLSDQIYFLLGQRHGPAVLARFPGLRARAARVQGLLQRYHAPLILSIRFLYGLRIVGPMAIGMSNVPWVRFLLFNMVGALFWAVGVTGAGYLFGNVLESVLADVRRYEKWVLLLILAGGAAAGIIRWWRNRRGARGQK